MKNEILESLKEDEIEEKLLIKQISNYIPSIISELGIYSASNEIQEILNDYSNNFLVNKTKYNKLIELFKEIKTLARNNILRGTESLNFSPKLILLLTVIHIESQNKNFRGIIFVTQRKTCILLAKFLQEKFPSINFGYLLGHGDKHFHSKIGMTINQQKKTLYKFRKGQIEILVATKIAQEGLDIQACNFVLCFCQIRSLIEYIQSRGRARKKNSNFYLFMDTNDQKAVHFIQVRKHLEQELKSIVKLSTIYKDAIKEFNDLKRRSLEKNGINSTDYYREKGFDKMIIGKEFDQDNDRIIPDIDYEDFNFPELTLDIEFKKFIQKKLEEENLLNQNNKSLLEITDNLQKKKGVIENQKLFKLIIENNEEKYSKRDPKYTYVSKTTKAYINLNSSKQKINQIYSFFPEDAYWNWSIKYNKTLKHCLNDEIHQYQVYFPIRTTMCLLTGDEFRVENNGKERAQSSVALKLCELCHKLKLFDEKLIPIKKISPVRNKRNKIINLLKDKNSNYLKNSLQLDTKCVYLHRIKFGDFQDEIFILFLNKKIVDIDFGNFRIVFMQKRELSNEVLTEIKLICNSLLKKITNLHDYNWNSPCVFGLIDSNAQLYLKIGNDELSKYFSQTTIKYLKKIPKVLIKITYFLYMQQFIHQIQNIKIKSLKNQFNLLKYSFLGKSAFKLISSLYLFTNSFHNSTIFDNSLKRNFLNKKENFNFLNSIGLTKLFPKIFFDNKLKLFNYFYFRNTTDDRENENSNKNKNEIEIENENENENENEKKKEKEDQNENENENRNENHEEIKNEKEEINQTKNENENENENEIEIENENKNKNENENENEIEIEIENEIENEIDDNYNISVKIKNSITFLNSMIGLTTLNFDLVGSMKLLYEIGFYDCVPNYEHFLKSKKILQDYEKESLIKIYHPNDNYYNVTYHHLSIILNYNFKDYKLLIQATTHPSTRITGLPTFHNLIFIGKALLNYFITYYLYSQFEDLSLNEIQIKKKKLKSQKVIGYICFKNNIYKSLDHFSGKIFKEFNYYSQDLEFNLENENMITTPKIFSEVFYSLAAAVFIDTQFDFMHFFSIFKGFFDDYLSNKLK
ncbi:endoribonuclease dicer [Anaeramoeba flamelloides]|uniref:Endoribonuclease dicer n=1 Tax=Anaeramoeba flamelloides TaxID=1746091 RepID=A0AAV8AGG4_9EUKA|nr:endoribonuclease dicer [Anaeramoeba flamelloides]